MGPRDIFVCLYMIYMYTEFCLSMLISSEGLNFKNLPMGELLSHFVMLISANPKISHFSPGLACLHVCFCRRIIMKKKNSGPKNK